MEGGESGEDDGYGEDGGENGVHNGGKDGTHTNPICKFGLLIGHQHGLFGDRNSIVVITR